MNRKQAIENNVKTYLCASCRNCGCTEKYVSSYGCVKCTLSRNSSEYIKQYSKTERAQKRIKEYGLMRTKSGDAAAAQRKYYKSNREKVKEYYHNNKEKWLESALKSKYNISLDDYYRLLERQDYACAICNSPIEAGNKSAHIDHCHSSGKVRGVLCHGCNTGIGLLKEDISIMKKAIDYLNG